MGQRHQIYVVNKTSKGDYVPIGAYHHQWCYGVTAATALVRAINLIQSQMSWGKVPHDSREIDIVIESTYGVDIDNIVSMVIEDNKLRAERGDNNDGCSLVVIDLKKKETRGCLFSINGLDGNYANKVEDYKPITPSEYVDFYYSKKEQKEWVNDFKKDLDLIKKSKIKKITQAEFNKITKG